MNAISKPHLIGGVFLFFLGFMFSLSAASGEGKSVPKFSELPEEIQKNVAPGTPRKAWEISDSPFGIHTTVMAEGADDAQIQKLVSLISEGGFKWAADYLTIGKVTDLSPEQVREKFTPLPSRCLTYAKLLSRSKVNLLVRLDPFPWEPWHGPAKGSFEEGSPEVAKAVEFVKTCVRQLKAYTRHWQIWNEPNIGNQNPLVSPRDYARIVKILSRAIREEQADAIIYGPGTAMLQCMDEYPRPWIPEVLEAGLADDIDVFSFHAYRAPAWRHNLPENASQFHPWTTWKDYPEQISELRKLTAKNNGGRALPLANTEDGLPNTIEGTGEQPITWVVAAKYELRRALLDFELGISPRIQFCLYRRAADELYDKQASFNTVMNDFQKKPQYFASQNLNAILDFDFKLEDSIPVSIKFSGDRRLRHVNTDNPAESLMESGGVSEKRPEIYKQVYRREHPDFDELLVFFWSVEPSEDIHIRRPARFEIGEAGWQAPLMIDLMAMPAKRPENEIVELISSDFVDRRDPEQLSGRTTASGVAIQEIEVRDYPLAIKWVRPKHSPSDKE